MSFLSLTVTSDVQSVTATVVGESTIDIQCLFIHGSDAVGCKVVLVSGHSGVNNETATLIRKNTSASAQLKLTHQVDCYHRVLAYTINVDNSTSNFVIMKTLNFGANNSCLGKKNTITQFKINEHNYFCIGIYVNTIPMNITGICYFKLLNVWHYIELSLSDYTLSSVYIVMCEGFTSYFS